MPTKKFSMQSSDTSKAASFDVAFSLSMYSVDALKRAAYVMMHRISVKFDISNEQVCCTITPLSDKEQASVIERDFLREVNDHDLRISIEAQTEQTRTAILGLTFSRTGLQG
jgi:His-Xaa-Ser system protein HxsD